MAEKVDQPVETGVQNSGPDSPAQAEAAAMPEASDQTHDVATLRAELDAARQEAAANYDKFLRSRADMENYKKRLERTYTDRTRASKKELLQRLLSVKDNLDRALQYEAATNGVCAALTEGVRLTRSQLDQLISHEGLKSIEALGKPFDPRREEAVQRVDDPHVPDHTVVQVLQEGYTYGDEDEVLRPAQVVVSVHGGDR